MEVAYYDELNGTVDEIIFSNEMNGYTVLSLYAENGNTVNVVGCLPFAAPGERIRLKGTWISHPTYGSQFRAEFAERQMPVGSEALYEYLASHVIKGVGPALASVIVSEFGNDALEVIENSPEKLSKIKGISKKKALEMSSEMKKQQDLRRLMEFLNIHGIKPQFAMSLYRSFGSKSLEIIRENPYVLSREYIGGDFADADKLAIELGLDGDSPERICAAILFELQHNSGNGHVFIPKDKLISATSMLIGVEADLISDGLDILFDSGDVINSQIAGCNACYLASLYNAEVYTAERLLRLASVEAYPPNQIDSIVEKVECENVIRYAKSQINTIEIALSNRVIAITGGPGTGKTTTIRALTSVFEHLGLTVQLAAPTGRAAKRMSELTSREALTIHRLLEAGYAENSPDLVFKRNEESPLKCDVLILDECSMIDIFLMKALMCAIPKDCRLILVGDVDQLPPVGPGNVFMDILRSNVIPVVRLTEIFRQTSESRIVKYAHEINDGIHPNITENKGDFFFMRRSNEIAARDLIVQLCSKRLPENLGIKPDEIQVLTPMRKGETGVVSLNIALQNALNPRSDGKKEKKYGDTIFRSGDRVMQIRNNYDIIWTSNEGKITGNGIYNGDIGYIISIDDIYETVTIDFDGRIAVYSFDLLNELEHAWAMTVHKSQGSEYRAVIACFVGGPKQLLYRGVLYTAVTRARELLIGVGEENIVYQMIDNKKQTKRYSGLRARLAGE